jgi:predicted glycoside hydrolase/deacetylase ChbG (UPF0249 family)
MALYKRIIFNADDFGYRKDINKGIIYAHKNGVVKSCSVLTQREAFEDAVFLSKENPNLKTGLHIDLDEFIEISRPQGTIARYKNFPPSKRQITDAIDSQLEKFLNAGLKLSHLDSHHHAHLLPEVLPLAVEKAKELNVPIRFFAGFYTDPQFAKKMLKLIDEAGVKHTGHFINGWYWKNIDEDFETAELMTHPGFNEIWREYELAKCCDPALIKYLKDKDIQVISYEEL